MDPLREIGKTLLVMGSALFGIGVLLFFRARLPYRIGRLPGDIVVQGRNGSFYFPIVTCIIVSLLLTLLMWILNLFRR
jgi:hypothetical protein